MMKFAMNHSWRFRNWRWAYFIGFAQMLMVISVETVNVIILCSNDTVMSIIMDFLALVIISDFDNFYVASLCSPSLQKDTVLKLIADQDIRLQRALTCMMTSSRNAKNDVEKNKFKYWKKKLMPQEEEEETETMAKV